MGLIQHYKQLKAIHSQATPRPEFRVALRNRLQATAVLQNRPLPFQYHPMFRVPAWGTAMAVLVLGLVGTSAYAYDSPVVAPGHFLYPLKHKLESARARMAYGNPEARTAFHLDQMDRRLREAENVPDASLDRAEHEFQNSINVIRQMPQPRRGNMIRNSLRREDKKHLQALAGMALREPEGLERVSKVLKEEQKYLEENLKNVQDPVARNVLERHLRVREALRDAIESTQLEEITDDGSPVPSP